MGVIGTNGISSSDGGSLTGTGPNDLDGPPPDLPPLPLPRLLKLILKISQKPVLFDVPIM